MTHAIGIDVGGTGIKGAAVDLDTGELTSSREKIPTPQGGHPDDVLAVVEELVARVDDAEGSRSLGICLPSVVVGGRTRTAANIGQDWIDLDAERRFEAHLGRRVHLVNDADAAGYAEVRYGAARGVDGLVIVTTLGTGIGSALIHDGVLVPNAELGHLELDGAVAEHRASNRAREREQLEWAEWAERLQRFYSHLERLFSPTLFVVGGGVSKSHEQFLPLLRLRTPIVPAALRNNAGIMGAAALANR